MFRRARLKLTLWYLLIVMVISMSFSFVIYRASAAEVERFDRLQRIRIENRFPYPPNVIVDNSLIEETENRIVTTLLFINVTIFVVSGITGYFLAGITLNPIKEMVDEQNRFISDASHEINTPLTSLKLGMEVYLRDKNGTLKEAKDLFKDNILEVNKLQRLSASLLRLAQFQKPNNMVKHEKVDLGKVILESIHKTESQAMIKNTKVETKLKKTQVLGNKFALEEVFTNLIDNAIKYSNEAGKIEIESKVIDGKVEVVIKDNGIGIAKEDLPHIFDRFYRADSARSKNMNGGYGLGLSITKKIIEEHGGNIIAESELGRGSTFKVYLPKFKM